MTLFEKEITAPIGSIGPFTIDEGLLYMESTGDFFKINAYELEKKLEDASVPQTWSAGEQSGTLGGLSNMLSLVGLQPVRQKASITISNPLYEDVPVTSSTSYTYGEGDETVNIPVPALDKFTMKQYGENTEVMSLDIAPEVAKPIVVNMKDLTFQLPAKLTSLISSTDGNLFFNVGFKHRCNLSVSDAFAFPLKDIAVNQVSLPVGKFKVKKVELTLDIENTVPMQVLIENIRVLQHKENAEDENIVNEDIEVSSSVAVKGGSIENPAVSHLTISIESLNGAIPDIEGVQMDINVKGQPELGPVPISAKQGIFIKSSSVRLTGGITIPQSN